MNAPAPDRRPTLRARRLGIDTYREQVVYMHAGCEVCRSEGFESQARVLVTGRTVSAPATINVVLSDLVAPGEAGLSEAAWAALNPSDGEPLTVTHLRPSAAMSRVRSKVYGGPLVQEDFRTIVEEVIAGRLSNIEIAAFLTACAGDRMSERETLLLASAMLDAGDRLTWPRDVVVDKHCIGGLPGNRTTPIVVAIVAARGGIIPKTSSRAITSPAGTADVMETLAPVAIGVDAMRRVVEREGGCVVWGGAAALSPADDILIRVERPLDLDSNGQLVASVLSKKAAAGSTHVVIDIPIGPTAKVRSRAAAEELRRLFEATAAHLGLSIRLIETDGAAPVGRGIGPALEAHDVLAVLNRSPDAPLDLRDRALALAGAALELIAIAPPGQGLAMAHQTLDSGEALDKFLRICEAQGGVRTPPTASYTSPVVAHRTGVVSAIDNRRLARSAKLAGAPKSPAAGLMLERRPGDQVERGQPLFVLHAETPGELRYAAEYVAAEAPVFSIDEQQGGSP